MNFVYPSEKLDYEVDHAYTAYEISPKVRVNGWERKCKNGSFKYKRNYR